MEDGEIRSPKKNYRNGNNLVMNFAGEHEHESVQACSKKL
jgi:hypothetical protein